MNNFPGCQNAIFYCWWMWKNELVKNLLDDWCYSAKICNTSTHLHRSKEKIAIKIIRLTILFLSIFIRNIHIPSINNHIPSMNIHIPPSFKLNIQYSNIQYSAFTIDSSLRFVQISFKRWEFYKNGDIKKLKALTWSLRLWKNCCIL